MTSFRRYGLLFFILFISLNTMRAQLATPDNFFVFVGERISLTYISPKPGEIAFDRGYVAKYKVDTSIYGNYSRDTVEFESYIHLGDSPAFSMHEHVLLYLSNHNGKWYQEKYQYNAVYRTKAGRWAGAGRSDDYGHVYNEHTRLKPEKIVFADSVKFDLSKCDSFTRSYLFENKYYIIKGNVAYPVAGNYIEDLFALKKSGVLKARGLF